MHKPIYTSPNGCSASSCEGSRKLSETYHPLFDKYGVDLVLQAHMHSYQRSFPIQYNAQDPSNPLITTYDKNNYNDPSGTIFAIVATGGINFHGLSGKAPFTASQQDDQFGALELTISNNDNKLVGKFYANNGKVTDEFNVVKTNEGTPISRSTQNTDLKAGIEVKESKEIEDTEAEDVEDTEAEDVEDTEAEDTEAEDTEAEDTEAEDTEAEDTDVEDTLVKEIKERKDTLVKEIKERKDTLVKEIKERKDTLVKKIKESTFLPELVQLKDWTEIDFSDPDSEDEENDGEENEVDSDILDTNSLEKSSKSKNKMLNPFASSAN
jgi:hypothetical protein